MGPEKRIEQAVCQYAKTLGYLVRKFTSPGRKGCPDRLLINPHGITLYIEFKAPGEPLDPVQVKELSRIADHNAPVYVIDDIEKGCRLISQWSAYRLPLYFKK